MRILNSFAILMISFFSFALNEEQTTSPMIAPPAQIIQPLTILYDDIPDPNAIVRARASNANPYLIIYQAADPTAIKTGLIDINILLSYIRTQAKAGLPNWCMLDFEDPFHEAMQEGIDSQKCKITILNMINAIRAVKLEFPNSKWTYYGMPSLPYWLDGGLSWDKAPEDLKRKTLEKAVAIYNSLFQEMDWVSPSLYAKYDPKFFPSQPPDNIREGGRSWRTAQVGLAKLLSNGKPIIPNISPWWVSATGKCDLYTVINAKEFIEDQVIPAIKMGATGFALWAALTYDIDGIVAVDQSKYPQDPKSGVPAWRAAVMKDYLNNQTPKDWSDKDVAQRLIAGMSLTYTNSISNIRMWEKAKILPP